MSPARFPGWVLIWAGGFLLLFLLSPYGPRQISLPEMLSPNGAITADWNVFYHLGGNGPWIRKVDAVAHGGMDAPEGCKVDQVHMISRHAERYPTSSAGDRMLALLQRIKASNVTFKGDLEFVNNWQYFSLKPSAHHDQLTTTGPYAGTLSAFAAGTKLRTRYLSLLTIPPLPHFPLNLWASDCTRVRETARYFATGFLGLDWDSSSLKTAAATAQLHIIPETPDRGGDTLTPGDTCLKYRQDMQTGHDYGLIQLSKFRSTYLPAIAARFQAQNPGIRFVDGELYSMQETCGFEILVRGSSPWCDVFTQEDWLNFEYARDVLHYYRAGPGNRFGPVMGSLWLNATAELLKTGPEAAGRLFFSFVHDGDIIPLLAALDLFPTVEPLPVTHRAPSSRAWRTSQIVPMNGRIIFERLTCNPTSRNTSKGGGVHHVPAGEQFIRINVNDGIVGLPICASGPGSSCPLEEFLTLVRRREEEVGDFRTVCGLEADAPAKITFLHQ